MPVLEIQNLSKSYGTVKALDKLNLTIEKGNVYGILGPNGSGKTTTLGIILGILQQSTGTYRWFDGEFGDHARMKIGAILETPNFYPNLNADKNLEIIAHIKKTPIAQFDEILEIVNLKDRRNSRFSSYSLGMKQRLAIGATLIGDPEVVIFDEPTNGLDPQGIAEVRNILRRVADSGKTVIMASHILNEVEKICSHVAIIKFGHLLTSGSVSSIIRDDLVFEIACDDMEVLGRELASINWINKVNKEKEHFECFADKGYSTSDVNRILIEKGLYCSHLVHKKKNLEQEFIELTS